ncbi:MAG: aminoglycoside phosphotransferase family protein [bacterium]|nr:aminoglycoside phosphotransferase family protein [bacterium]
MEYSTNDKAELEHKIQKLLCEEITHFSLKGKGWCNNAYYVETREGGKYIVKQESDDKRGTEQNNLVIEANLIQKLSKLGLSVPVPSVVFVSENPRMYCYKYIEGEILRDVWEFFSEEEKINTCHTVGLFHAEIGKIFTKEMARTSGIKIDESADVHPEVTDEYNKALINSELPDNFKKLLTEAKKTFDSTSDKAVFQFIHNDSHHENIIIQNGKISGIIDFGNAEWGEVAKDFSRYIRDYPRYFQYIVSAYEKKSENKLSYERLVNDALVCGVADIVEDYMNGGENRARAENTITTYKKLIAEVKGK